jgi:ribosomal protein S1
MEVVSIGDVITVQVLSVDKERGKVALTMKTGSAGNKR